MLDGVRLPAQSSYSSGIRVGVKITQKNTLYSSSQTAVGITIYENYIEEHRIWCR